ncbi:MAG: SH3 domain-containing protein, partial [Clostridiales bacterium]|nr:SH3 domain-containing protein [Clostridiales bacterium]
MKVTKRLNIITMVMVLIFTTFAFTAANTVNASNKIGIVTATSLNVRTGPSTAYASIGYLKNGDKVTILGTEGTFYKISYNSSSGSVAYASTKYINIIDQGATEINPDFEAHMKAQGFPESYKPALRQLHAEHPKWIFMAQKTNLDWNTVVSQESVLGRNLVSQYRDVSWRSMEKGSYNSSTNTYMTFDGSWYAASSTVIAHYLDPRNFLNDTSIFMFESLSYNSSVHTQTNVANILNNSFMKGNYTTPDTKKTYSYAETFIAAAKDSGVSPYHLASRALQEQGTVGNALSTGTVSGFPGYFNFFNIQAYTANGYTAVQNGAKYAMTTNSKYILPWTNQRKSIIGGAIWIGTGYIDKLQDTLYLQKFDVVDGGNGYYKHQYMTNVQAPFSEASLMKKAYTTEM